MHGGASGNADAVMAWYTAEPDVMEPRGGT